MIRAATHADIPALVEMGRQFHAASYDRDIPYDESGATDFFRALIASDQGCVLVNGCGFIAGILSTLPQLQKSYIIANECYWWAEKDGGELHHAFERWAAAAGAQRIVTSHRHDHRHRALERRYRMMGYQPYEHYYVKPL